MTFFSPKGPITSDDEIVQSLKLLRTLLLGRETFPARFELYRVPVITHICDLNLLIATTADFQGIPSP